MRFYFNSGLVLGTLTFADAHFRSRKFNRSSKEKTNGNFILFNHLIFNRNGSTRLLISTYVVCERLSVMHEPAGVVENLVQILQNTPIL